MDDGQEWELLRWLHAIEVADTWRDLDPGDAGPKKAGDLNLLAGLMCSGTGVPEGAREQLADLLTRHRLKAKGSRTPRYTVSESELDARVLMDFVADFRSQPHFPRGPIKKEEMRRAIQVKQLREKARGQANKKFDGKKAAGDLREEIIRTYADYYGLNFEQFKNALDGKHGSINRRKSI
ncbi:hypothetical protein [Bradyrhizobium sp. RT3b]|uniref:hypothetical protein n=1 Tax=Bradyrhizobium sp. RT3b TaxID=3156334 RepID=UPI003397D7AF